MADFIALTKDGEWGKSEPFEDSVQMRIIRGTDFAAVREGDWSSVPTRYVSSGHARLKSLADNDILIETAGGSRDRPTGRTLFLRSGTIAAQDLPVTCASFARFIRLDPGAVEPEFVYWWLQHLYETRQLLAFHTQHTGVARFQWTTFSHSISVPAMHRSVQQRIAAILSAYDDLIEKNTRRIKLLEEMGQRLYREWFVHLRYPSHEEVAMVRSELGPIPEGWSIVAFTELADILSGGTPRTTVAEYWDGAIPFFTPRDAPETIVATSTEKHVSQVGVDRSNSEIYPKGTVFITARGTVGKVAMAGVPMAMNQSCYAIRGRNGVRQGFVLFALMNQVGYLRTNTGGATFSTIIVDTFRRMRSIAPPQELIDTFASLADPIIGTVTNLQLKSENLRTTRDFLVPRLISGEIDLTDLTIAMPVAAA